MYTYRCPGCGKYHAAEGEFRQEYSTKCLRCGVSIYVTAELVHQSSGAARLRAAASAPAEDAITKAPAKEAVGVAGKRAAAADMSDERMDAAVDAAADAGGEEEEVEAVARDKGSKRRPAESDRVKTAKKKPAKSLPRRDEDEEDEAEDEAPGKAPPEKPAAKPSKPTPAGAKKARPKWQLIAAIAAAVLVIGGASGFFLFGGSSKKAPEKKVAEKKAPPPKQTPKPAPPPEKKAEQPPPKPTTTAPPNFDLALSASRLSAELAANAAEANVKYAGKVVQVSGLFSKIERKNGLLPPPRPHAVFNAPGTSISCDLQGSFSEEKAWNALKPNQPLTVRGRYEKDGFLRDCYLMPFAPTAETNYKSKKIEVSGSIAEILEPTTLTPYPGLRLEGETNSAIELRCLFRKADHDEVRKLKPGDHVTLQGDCSGRAKRRDEPDHVRIDNCQLIYSSAPPAGTPRVEAAQLLREYEEDTRPYYLPPLGQEERVASPLTIRELAQEHAANRQAFEKKYRGRVLTVIGKPLTAPRGGQLTLESGDTDLWFRVDCMFSKHAFDKLPLRQSEYRVRGLYAVQPTEQQGQTIRLENCALDEKFRRGPELTADFLPHKPGRSFTVDVALFGVLVGKKIGTSVRREIHVQGANGATEAIPTHMGMLQDRSLFDEGQPERWFTAPRTVKVKVPASTIYFQRLSAGFVETGTPAANDKGKLDVEWMPSLKLNAREGEKWEWNPPSGEHKYVLEKIEEAPGRTSAAVREIHVPPSDLQHAIETLHVYVQGVGEVERRQWRHLNARGDKQLILEMRMVEKKVPSPGDKPSATLQAPKPPLSTTAQPPMPK